MGKPLVVGICSRESEESYGWIQRLLGTERFKKKVKEVIPISITNTTSQFSKDVSKCSFAILYHSKRRGRLNITDVTDSLYDTELELMHDKLGKENVIVVADDLEDSSSEEKGRIERNQQSIGRWACELFLFSKADKDSVTGSNGKSTNSAVHSELEKLREILKAAKKKSSSKKVPKKDKKKKAK